MVDWTTPKTWADEELVTANLLNTHLRDNLNALKSPPTDHYECDEASDYTTNSTSFVDVDATKLARTITTTGGDVLVVFMGTIATGITNNYRVFLDIDLDGMRLGGDDGLVVITQEGTEAGPRPKTVTLAFLATGLDAGSHTFTLQWRVNSGSGTLYAGAGTTSADVHPQFWVREVS